ncbi:MAG: 2OG-Fe(II) oxygenase [Proteobacteria bacterium]|nr:2OG-Fe(II) oxygenase [Pseudomonadota bacterium]
MIFVLPNILTPQTLSKVRQLAQAAEFVDGMQTAGNAVRQAKHNREVAVGSEAAQAINLEINRALEANNDFQIVTIPQRLSPFLISRYTTGMRYGDHSDNAVLSGDSPQRSDMSMTLFLNDPDEYDGGALTLNTDLKPESYTPTLRGPEKGWYFR